MKYECVHNNCIMENIFCVENYKPCNVGELICNANDINIIKVWLNEYYEVKELLMQNDMLKKKTKGRKKKVNCSNDYDVLRIKRNGNMMIMGNHGCGKTCLIRTICEELGYEIIDFNKFKTIELEPIKMLKKLSNDSLFYDNGNKKKMLLIDNFDSIVSKCFVKYVLMLMKDNNFFRYLPIIVITNMQHSSNTKNMKKTTDIITMPTLDNVIIENWVLKICEKYDIVIGEKNRKILIKKCAGDLRKMLFVMNHIKKSDGLSDKKLSEFMNMFVVNKNNKMLFNNTEKMIGKYESMNECLEFFKPFKGKLSLMLYDNYYNYLKADNEEHLKILKNMAFGDLLENYIHGEQSWYLNNIFGYVSCAIPSYYITKNYNKKHIYVKFYEDVNKTSSKKKHCKKMNEENLTNLSLMNNSGEEYIFLRELIE